MSIWYTFCECIKICTHLVMAQCLHLWLPVCFLQEQDCFEIMCWSLDACSCWYTFCECIKTCTHLVMVQCLNFWLLLCFLQEQHWLWNNSTSTASLQGADTRHFIASVHVDLIHFLWVHWDLHTPSSKTIWRQSTDFQTNWNAKPNQQNPTSNAKCRASGNANCNATIASHLAICPCNVQVAKSLKWCWLHLEWLLL